MKCERKFQFSVNDAQICMKRSGKKIDNIPTMLKYLIQYRKQFYFFMKLYFPIRVISEILEVIMFLNNVNDCKYVILFQKIIMYSAFIRNKHVLNKNVS